MSKKNINPSDPTIRVCVECGAKLRRKGSNVCDECVERLVKGK